MDDARPLVLVVDDDPSITALVRGLLESIGYAVRCAADPLQAMHFVLREQPGLIIADLMMPAGGGLTLLQRLSANARTKDIPVLVISACEDSHVQELARRRGAYGFLPKPISHPALLAAVGDLLRPAPIAAPVVAPSAPGRA